MVHHGMQVADDVPPLPPSLPMRSPACRWTAMGTSQYPLPMGAWRFGRASVPPNSRRTDGTCTFEVRMRFPSLASPALSPPSSFPRPRSKAPSSGEDQQHLQREIGTNFHPDPPLPIDFSLQAPQSQICSPLALILLSMRASPSTAGQWSMGDGRWMENIEFGKAIHMGHRSASPLQVDACSSATDH